VSIPEGFSAIVSMFGALKPGDLPDNTWSPGFHWFNPLYSVDKLVSKQLIVFDTPVKDVKTKDAIPVNIDVLMTFEIVRAPDFVYSIGPEKFDDLLRASQDEALRQVASRQEVQEIYDLHGASYADILQELNAKFEKYGVVIHHFTVKNVTIPAEFADRFEKKTLLDAQTVKRDASVKSDHLKLNNEEGKAKLREECLNAKMAAQQQSEVVTTKAVKDTSEVIARTEKDIAELETSWDIQKQQIVTDAELKISTYQSDILKTERKLKSETDQECNRLATDAAQYQKNKQAKTHVAVASKLSEGHKKLGAAEGEAAEAFAAVRQHEADLSRLDILGQLVRNEAITIATSQENTVGLSEDNKVVTQVAQQGLEALRAKLAEITATSLAKLEETRPLQQSIKR
jgi:regulator of protease activity HflC (stomatin/prohibitin superfamily)